MRFPLGVAADEPHEDRYEGEREEHHTGRDEVDRRDEDEDGDRHDHREHELRQVARERRLERVDAGDGDRRDLGAPRAVERRRPVAEPPLDEVESQLREHGRRCAPPGNLEAPRRGGPSRCGGAKEHEGQPEACERGAAERPGRDVGEQGRLDEHEERRDHAERRVGAEQHAHPARASKQARVETTHGD